MDKTETQEEMGDGRISFLHESFILHNLNNMTTEQKFQAAVNIIRSLPKDGPYQPSHDMMLKFYALYKQAIEGPCQEPKPAFYEVVKGYKWRAWNSLGNMTKAEAMNAYVDELKKIIETMAYTEDVATFIDTLGPFYEFIDMPGKKNKNNNNDKEKDNPEDKKDDSTENDTPVTNGLHVPDKMNGIHDLDSDSGSGSDAAQSSSQDNSPQHAIAGIITEESKEETYVVEDEEEHVVVEVRHERADKTTHTLTLSPRVYSDTDSDEEYSEPAETPDHLAKVESLLADQGFTPTRTYQTVENQVSASYQTGLLSENVQLNNRSASDIVTCGGGDQSHPGGLQMTPRQSQQRFGATPRNASQLSSGSLATPIHSGGFIRGGAGGGSGGDGGSGGGTDIAEDVNAQLVVVLRRLQSDMENVLHRLNTLETITLSQHHSLCHHCQTGSSSTPTTRMEPSWWPFPELSPRSTFFLLVWPLILHGGIKLLILLRSRRRRR